MRLFLGVGRPVGTRKPGPKRLSDPINMIMGSDDSGLVGGRRVPNLKVYELAGGRR